MSLKINVITPGVTPYLWPPKKSAALIYHCNIVRPTMDSLKTNWIEINAAEPVIQIFEMIKLVVRSSNST